MRRDRQLYAKPVTARRQRHAAARARLSHAVRRRAYRGHRLLRRDGRPRHVGAAARHTFRRGSTFRPLPWGRHSPGTRVTHILFLVCLLSFILSTFFMCRTTSSLQYLQNEDAYGASLLGIGLGRAVAASDLNAAARRTRSTGGVAGVLGRRATAAASGRNGVNAGHSVGRGGGGRITSTNQEMNSSGRPLGVVGNRGRLGRLAATDGCRGPRAPGPASSSRAPH